MIVKAYAIKAKESELEREIREKILYITDPTKVLGDRSTLSKLKLGSEGKAAAEFVRGIFLDWDGLPSMRYVSTYHCTEEYFYQKCLYLRKLYETYQGKSDSGPVAWHVVLSWPKEDRISDEEVHEIGCELLKAFEEYPAILGVHIEPVLDKKTGLMKGVCKHCHILFCAYPDSFEGMPHKISFGKGSILLKEQSDMLAIRYGQTILVCADTKQSRGYYLSEQERLGKSWLADLKNLVRETADCTGDTIEFREAMRSQGYEIKEYGPYVLYDNGEHTVREERLGRSCTMKQLELQWEGKRPSKRKETGNTLEALQRMHGPVYAQIPLGGYDHPNRKSYRFLLSDRAINYREVALSSYFLLGETYSIVDCGGDFVAEVDGEEILGYLAVGNRAVDVRSIDERELHARIKAREKRLFIESARTCEKQTEVFELKNYYCIHEGKRKGYYGSKKQVDIPRYDHTRDPQGKKRSALEMLFLLVCLVAIPDFDICKYSYQNTLTTEVACFGPLHEGIQRQMDYLHTMRTEGFDSDYELEQEAKAAGRRYFNLLKKVAVVEEKLEQEERLHWATEAFFEVDPQIKALLMQELQKPGEERKSVKKLYQENEALFKRYEDAVRTARGYAIENYNDLAAVHAEYDYLKSALPALKQALAAEFERRELLRLANETAKLTEAKRALACLGQRLNEMTDAEKEKLYKQLIGETREEGSKSNKEKPSINAMIKSAETVRERNPHTGKKPNKERMR